MSAGAPDTPDAGSSGDGAPILEVTDVVAGYERRLPILHGASLHVSHGEIVCLLGPNGAGKSTLIKVIAGVLKASSGSVSFLGSDVTGLETFQMVREGLAYVPQTENVFAKLSVEENLELGALVNRARYHALRERVFTLFPDLKRLRRLAAGKLSGGQRQMVAVGRALMAEPRLLILDEPSAGLSPKLTDEVLGQLQQIRAAGVTILMVEQKVRAALKISDRGYIMAEGRERIEGAAATLLDDKAVGELYLGVRPQAADGGAA